MRPALLAVLALSLAPATAGASETYKCLDKGGRVTYSNVTCEKLGLRLASIVIERVSVIATTGLGTPTPAAPRATLPDASPR
ncbi:MAG: DUF4124 domain-containing protein [Betaproteobacteria bacterium]|nr:DUF4124 domain-containing protein [Betaproteobacteria bacterium]